MADATAKKPRKRVCAVMPHHFQLAETDPVYRDNRRRIEAETLAARAVRRPTIVRIPVVVHVLYHKDRENIGIEQIESQIAALNRDYRLQNPDRSKIPTPFQVFAADTLIEFGLAVRDPDGNPTDGVTRTRTSKRVFPYDEDDEQATEKLDAMIKFDGFGKAAWPRDSYLNLWVCSLGNDLAGYSQFPGGPAATDGVVIRNTAFGSGGIAKRPFHLGRTAVHEIGHWLNLLHIWGDDDGGCRTSDNVADTPNQAEATGSEVRLSDFPRISCNNGPYGDMFMNFMDYVNDDTLLMFTKGQSRRMNATLEGPRASLMSSMGLTAVPTERFEAAAAAEAVAFASMVPQDEQGTPPTTEFDGVSWVPV